MLAATLRGVVGQRLVPRADGAGRAAVCEVLVATGRRPRVTDIGLVKDAYGADSPRVAQVQDRGFTLMGDVHWRQALENKPELAAGYFRG